MKPEDLRARCITTHEGRYVNLDDVKNALQDDGFMQDAAAMLVVAHERKDGLLEGLRQVIGHVLWRLVGDEARKKRNT